MLTDSDADNWNAPAGPSHAEKNRRSPEFDALVDDIRRVYSADNSVSFRLNDLVRRRLGIRPLSVTAAMLGAILGAGIRLGCALLATSLAGDWSAVPWARWAAIVLAYGLLEGLSMRMAQSFEIPRLRRTVENWTSLLPAMTRESDLHELADFLRRWLQTAVNAAVGVAVAGTMLAGALVFAGEALADLPAGSVVLLALVLYDFGATAIYWGNLINWAFTARSARYEHDLFWPSPADSPEIRQAMRATVARGFATGMWITGFLALTLVLVPWESALLVPLAVGYLLISYLTSFGLAFSNRRAIRRIVDRIRDQRMAVLQDRIAAFGPRFADLSPEESERLRGLIELHNLIRDAPSSPTTARTALSTAAAMIIPTIMFVVTSSGRYRPNASSTPSSPDPSYQPGVLILYRRATIRTTVLI